MHGIGHSCNRLSGSPVQNRSDRWPAQDGHDPFHRGRVHGQHPQALAHRVGVHQPRLVVPQVGDQHVVDFAAHEEQLLRFVQGQHDDRQQRAHRSGLLHDCLDPVAHRQRADEDLHHVAGLRV